MLPGRDLVGRQLCCSLLLLATLCLAGCAPRSPLASVVSTTSTPTGSRPEETIVATLPAKPTHTASPFPTPVPCPTSRPTVTPLPMTPGPSTSSLVEAVFEMPTGIKEAIWGPQGAVLAMATGEKVFLARGPAFEVQEVA